MMTTESIQIPFEGKNNASLSIYVPGEIEHSFIKNRPTVLIFPGGGYSFLSSRESECIALRFLSIGFNAAVLYYSVKEDARFPQSLCEAALAMAYLKENSEKYRIDTSRIYTCGFSAGAHLALSLGVFWDKTWLAERVGKDNELLRPTAQIISYPVVTSDPSFSHAGSMARLLGESPSPEEVKLLELDKQVSPSTPPTFLWTTYPDKVVSSKNSLVLALALREANVPTEFHLYGWGGHGLSLASLHTQKKANYGKPLLLSGNNPHIATWFQLCSEWLLGMFGVDMKTEEE